MLKITDCLLIYLKLKHKLKFQDFLFQKQTQEVQTKDADQRHKGMLKLL